MASISSALAQKRNEATCREGAPAQRWVNMVAELSANMISKAHTGNIHSNGFARSNRRGAPRSRRQKTPPRQLPCFNFKRRRYSAALLISEASYAAIRHVYLCSQLTRERPFHAGSSRH